MKERSPHLQPEGVAQSMQVLRYRGVFYTREMQSSNAKLTNIEGVHLLNRHIQTKVKGIGQCIFNKWGYYTSSIAWAGKMAL